MDNKVVLYKFFSGEEVICTIVNETETSVEVKDCVQLIYRPLEKGAMTVGFAPYQGYASGNITIYTASLATKASPNQELTDEYNRIFGAGIVIASANDAVLKAQ